MNTNRIIFRYVLGVIAEAALIAGTIYGVLWVGVAASDHLTAAGVTLLYVATFAAGLVWMWRDSHHSADGGEKDNV